MGQSDKPPFSWDDFRQIELPKQIFFASIDVIDSTRLKNQTGKDLFWIQQISAMLSEIPTYFLQHYKENREKCGCLGTCTDKCIIATDNRHIQIDTWKYLGDEVVITAEMKCPTHPYLLVQALRSTLIQLERETSKNRKSSQKGESLAFKGAAWVAGFPVANKEVFLGIRKKRTIDYMGPSIDLGFRLAKLATREKIILSESLVYFLASNNHYPIKLFSGGNINLHGLRESKVPLFWTALDDSHLSNDELIKESEASAIYSFITKRFKKRKDILPFIFLDKSKTPEEAYIAKYLSIISELRVTPSSRLFYDPKDEGSSTDKVPESIYDALKNTINKITEQKK